MTAEVRQQTTTAIATTICWIRSQESKAGVDACWEPPSEYALLHSKNSRVQILLLSARQLGGNFYGGARVSRESSPLDSCPADGLAAPLARDGDPELVHIEETDANFTIEWKGHYRIEDDAFIYVDRKTGRTRAILGYPTHKLEQAARSS